MKRNPLAGLNPAQQRAAQHVNGPLLIVAGPGSGKTRVIVHRVAYLVEAVGVFPRTICVLTFTNRAARELRLRLARLLGGRAAQEVSAGTFHALCARILRQDGDRLGIDPAFTIYDRDDQLSAMKRAMADRSIDPKQFPPAGLLGVISGAKAQLQSVDDYRAGVGSYYEEIVSRAYESYERVVRANKAADFDDLLFHTYRLFANHPDVLERYHHYYRHLMVDEFQDTNVAQFALVRQLTGPQRNIAVVGDPDQAIYSWRHADIRNILSFKAHYPDAESVYLEENYRSSANILEAASQVIRRNQQRLERRLVPTAPAGQLVCVHEAYDNPEEAAWVVQELTSLRRAGHAAYRDVAIAYRVNAQSRALEEACLREEVPYRLVGALRFYQRREIRDVIAYLRLLHNPADDVSMQRVLNVPPRGIGDKTVADLLQFARANDAPLREAMQLLAAGLGEDAPFSRAGRASLARFSAVLDELQRHVGVDSVPDLIDRVLKDTGYRDHLDKDIEQGDERQDNIRELRVVAAEAAEAGDLAVEDALPAFLTRVALVSDADNASDDADAVTLITLHQCKGLEFDTVFMVGMEEGLLPHIRSMDAPDEIEEERRLCYVGMTRAKSRLYLTRAFQRRMMGRDQYTHLPSRFLKEIPPECYTVPTARAGRQGTASSAPTAAAPGTAGTAWGDRRAQAAAGIDGAPATPSGPPFKPGDKVRHRTFGAGIVVSCTAVKDDFEVTVAFPDVGPKRLLHSLAGLERVA